MKGITASEAAGRLGVKLETIYAYVSRGALRSWRPEGERTSRFDPDEVDALARRGRPRRTTRPPALDFVIHTGLTTVTDHDLRYRGRSAVALARTAAFEDVARWLWTGEDPGSAAPWQPREVAIGDLPTPRDRLRAAVVAAAAAAPAASEADLSTPAVVRTGQILLATMVAAVGPPATRCPRLHLASRPPRPGALAGQLWCRLAGRAPTPALVAALNAALVLLADHELAASTLAARVAASARADPFAVVLAGLGPLAGPLHGGASVLAGELLAATERDGPRRAIAAARHRHGRLHGFGHALYPLGDPRAVALLEALRSAAPGHPVLASAQALVEAVRTEAGAEPNVDLALAALAGVAAMPESGGEVVFTLARTAGWIAHAIEEYAEPPLRFRPRAVPRPGAPAPSRAPAQEASGGTGCGGGGPT